MAEKSVPAPNVVINDVDKLYLAAALKSSAKLSHVFTLVCASAGNRKYDLIPHTEIATFTDASAANTYYRAVREMMEYQSHARGVAELHKILESYKLTFNERIR